MNNLPLISVVIPTYNAERTLERCLQSIKSQDYKGQIEAILVDNFSNDGTKEIAKKFEIRFIEEKCGRSRARNIGAKLAGKYLLFLDSDMYLSESVIRKCAEILETENNKVALYIPERIIGDGFWIKVRNFEREFYEMTCIDAVRFIRSDIFRKVGGFDENLILGEDWDLDRRIWTMGKVGIVSAVLYHDEGKFNVKRYLRKKKYYMKYIRNYICKWGKEDPIVRKQLGAWYRFMKVFVENGKWKRLLSHPILVLTMYCLRFQIAIIYIFTKTPVD